MEFSRPRILEWATIPFSRGSSWPRDQTQVSHTCRQVLYHLNHLGSPCYNLLNGEVPRGQNRSSMMMLGETPGLGLPQQLSGKESACKCRRYGFNHRSRKIPHATEQLLAATTEPTCCNYWSPHTLEPVLWNKRSHWQWESRTLHLESSPPLTTTREKPEQQLRPSTAQDK